jgi:hypothetical protein
VSKLNDHIAIAMKFQPGSQQTERVEESLSKMANAQITVGLDLAKRLAEAKETPKPIPSQGAAPIPN